MWVNPLDTQEGRLVADVLSFPWLATRFAKCPGETANHDSPMGKAYPGPRPVGQRIWL
jgi:hypothetical protein